MRRALALAASAAVLGVVAISSGAAQQTPRLSGPPTTVVQYGYVRSLVRADGAYRMRFDPAFWLTGATAQRAAVEDGVVAPGEAVPNDYYIRNETKKQLSYVLPRNARVTVVTNPAGGLRSTRIAVSELAAIVKGRNHNGRTLYGPSLGYWARIAGDRVVALDQQYQP
jgi:hypothetical protein